MTACFTLPILLAIYQTNPNRLPYTVAYQCTLNSSTNEKPTSHPSGWTPQSWWLWFGFLSPGSYHLGNEECEKSVIVGPGLQFYDVVSVEDTHGVVSRVQHSEGGRSQAHWDMEGSCWNWFQYRANGWISSAFRMRKRFPKKKNIWIFRCLEQYADFHFICKT